MEIFEVLLGALAFGLVVLVPVLAIVAFVRAARLPRLERRLWELEQELALLRDGAAPAPRREPAAPAEPQPEPLTPPTPEPVSAAPRSAPPPVPSPAPAATSPAPAATSPAPAAPLSLAPEPLPARRRALEALPPLRPPTPVPTPRPQRPRIEWERWIGVRGAALASGLVIAIAGILFYRHAVEQGWVRPKLRVGAGAFAGLVAIGGAELLRRRDFHHAPAALAGAGTVLLYASLWAAHRLYAMLPAPATLVGMSIVTLGCGWLSLRHAAQTVAGIGVLGGFATPLVLQTESPSALGLFGYVLLLDLGLIALARRSRWPLLGALGLLGSFGIQLLWFARHLDAGSLPVTLAALTLFGLAFATLLPREGRPAGLNTAVRSAALLLPFAFVLHVASSAELGERLYPLALVAAPLLAGACWMARRQTLEWLPGAAAAGAVALVGAWGARSAFGLTESWELAGCALALALPAALLALGCEDERRRQSIRLGASVAGLGLLVVLAAAAERAPATQPAAPLALGLAALALVVARLGGPGLYAFVPPLGGALLGLGLTLLVHDASPRLLPEARGAGASYAWLLGGVALLHAQVWIGSREHRRGGLHAAAACAAATLALLPDGAMAQHAPWPVALGGALALGLSVAGAAAGLRLGGWSVVATLLTGYAQIRWIQTEVRDARLEPERMAELAPLFLAWASAQLFIGLPALSRRLGASAASWRAAALAPAAWFFGLAPLYEQRVGEPSLFVLPLALAAALALALLLGSPRTAREPSTRRVAAVWMGAFACVFAAGALADLVGEYELRAFTALSGLALLVMWRRLDHLGLQLWGCFLLALAALGVLGDLESGSYASAALPVFNWMSYAHLVPAAAYAGSAALLAPLEVARARPWQAPFYRGGRAWLSGLCGLAAALTIFAWINLSIFDLFGEGERIVIDLDRDEGRDLALSIAWIVYALALLALGMARRASAMRWLSLAFLVLALGKVFLYDLGELEGLYRVVSLLGLGLSLLVVSLLYQRFVFPRERRPRDGDPLAEDG